MTGARAGASTRERILDAALDLFAEEGFSGTTITAVERKVGLTAGTGSFYRHFRSKEELLRAAVEREVARCRAEIAEARAAARVVEDPLEQRVIGLEQALSYIRRFDRLFRLMLTEGDRVPELQDAITTALGAPGEELSWEESPTAVVTIAALGGYHLLSLMQGRPFQGVGQEDFLAALALLTEQAHGDRA
ncbi:MAG: helix-turn-helix domain-containing protein [Acidimicrobiales bacterium]